MTINQSQFLVLKAHVMIFIYEGMIRNKFNPEAIDDMMEQLNIIMYYDDLLITITSLWFGDRDTAYEFMIGIQKGIK